MYCRTLILFVCFTEVGKLVSSSELEKKIFHKYAVPDKRLEPRDYVIETRSSIKCAGSCQQRDGCVAVSFKDSTGSCEGYSLRPNDASVTVVDEPGMQIFYNKRICTGWTFQGSCYTVGDSIMNWQDSKFYWQKAKLQNSFSSEPSFCEADGRKLIEINDKPENDFITEKLHADLVFLVWTGGNDLQQEGTFVWNDGDALTYKQYSFTEPNGGKLANCIWLNILLGGNWDDTFCSIPMYPLCEIPL